MQKTGTFLEGIQPADRERTFGTIHSLNRQYGLGISKRDITDLGEAFDLTRKMVGGDIDKKIIVPYYNLGSRDDLPSLMECLRYQLRHVGIEDLFFNYGVMENIALCRCLGDGGSGLATVSFVPGGVRRYNSKLFIEMLWAMILHPELVIGLGQNRPKLILPGVTMKVNQIDSGKRTCTIAVIHTGKNLLFEVIDVKKIDSRAIVPIPYSAIA